ncbi:hypothetical protein [Paracoccus solventivorans]|uniref:hypothetical protein n=1 Tax=Paracoccus solventivorans TaxID=53463 RepID=UPI000A4EB829|nr:hypothetical protein [Paracoccus solventivorans]
MAITSAQPHPDAASIRDWALYGPRDPAIATLVERLAYERQMRLNEVEQLIVDVLTTALNTERKPSS